MNRKSILSFIPMAARLLILLIVMVTCGVIYTSAAHAVDVNSPVCEVGQVSEIDNCVQGQLPEETQGRQIDPVYGEVVIDGPDFVLEPLPIEEATQLPDERIGRQIEGTDGKQYIVTGIAPNGDLIVEPVVAAEQPAVITPPEPQVEILDAVEPEHPPMLAETGVPFIIYVPIAVALIVIGGLCVRFRNRKDA